MVWECIHAKQANQQMIGIGAHVPTTTQRGIRRWERKAFWSFDQCVPEISTNQS
jgi:predicted alpha/beta hydrolase